MTARIRVMCALLLFFPIATENSPAETTDMLHIQVSLDRAGFSPGEIDGRDGTNTQRAAEAYARARQSPEASLPAVEQRLAQEQANAPALIAYTITAEDTKGPFNPEIPADLMEQSALPALGYRSLLEALGEKFHASPALLTRLNPGVALEEGAQITVPNVGVGAAASERTNAGPVGTSGTDGEPIVRVSKAVSAVEVIAADGSILFYAPVTSGSEFDPLPIGEWKVTGVGRMPTFNYNPELFWDADPSHAKAKIPPGPNNPVGIVWIDIDKPHYGLHGTPEPSRVGKTESHGCVRLTNWDADRLASFVRPETKVLFVP
jgi:lipoprotein-anchoring transpeptidase ErfK/SrfK